MFLKERAKGRLWPVVGYLLTSEIECSEWQTDERWSCVGLCLEEQECSGFLFLFIYLFIFPFWKKHFRWSVDSISQYRWKLLTQLLHQGCSGGKPCRSKNAPIPLPKHFYDNRSCCECLLTTLEHLVQFSCGGESWGSTHSPTSPCYEIRRLSIYAQVYIQETIFSLDHALRLAWLLWKEIENCWNNRRLNLVLK
jgi:hypothetical protein